MPMFEEQQLLMCYGVMYHFLVILVSQEKTPQKQMQNSKKKNLLHFKSAIAISWYLWDSQRGTRETSEELTSEVVYSIISEICSEEKI